MSENRKPRSTETRAAEERRKPWTPPNLLDAPVAPEGYVHRWISVEINGRDNKANAMKRLREGWEMVRADEHPEYVGPVHDNGSYTGVIGHGGLILCRMPKETVAERNAYYTGRTREQMTAVENDLMKEEHKEMPIHQERRSRVVFGGSQTPSS